MSRHTARIHAFNLIFQFPFHIEWDMFSLKEAVSQHIKTLPDLEGFVRGLYPDKEDHTFIADEVFGTFSHLSQIDNQIEGLLKDWELNRIAKVDLALLRLAMFEMQFSADISPATAINEAVELAKVYGTDDSPSFINGLLGQATKDAKEANDG